MFTPNPILIASMQVTTWVSTGHPKLNIPPKKLLTPTPSTKSP